MESTCMYMFLFETGKFKLHLLTLSHRLIFDPTHSPHYFVLVIYMYMYTTRLMKLLALPEQLCISTLILNRH